jgi:hypothetical protein
MAKEKVQPSFSWSRVILKGLLLFLVVDLLVAPLLPLNTLGRISAYNHIFPGRARLPYGENPDQAYNFSLYNLEAMFASHELSAGRKPANEYRVLLIGDSSVWGYLLKPEETLSADINAAQLKLDDGRSVRVYNLGYPTLSVTKDLLILQHAMPYQPDMVLWLLTLESLPVEKQLESPILQNNATNVKNLIKTYSLNLNPNDPRLVDPHYWSTTLIGERRPLADLIRLQLYGVMWAATGVDQYYPATHEPPQADLSDDQSFQGLQPPQLLPRDLSLDVLSAVSKIPGNVPILFVNEPIYLSRGQNSDIRYNFFYPRWAYDQYRQIFNELCLKNTWLCLDEWNLVSSSEFTNSAIHMTPNATRLLASKIENAILSQVDP